MFYNLESSMSDRVAFDETVERYAGAMLNALTIDEAMLIEADTYAELAWDDGDGWDVDDMAEAKARFFSVFPTAVREWQEQAAL